MVGFGLGRSQDQLIYADCLTLTLMCYHYVWIRAGIRVVTAYASD